MSKNFLTITEVIDNCSLCRNHVIEQLITPDPFECDLGLFCTKAKDPTSSGHQTINGWTDHRLVAADEDPRKWADIPDWCPRLHKP